MENSIFNFKFANNQVVMATKRYRKPNKSKEITYQDIKDFDLNTLSSEDLSYVEQYGLGSWVKRNALNVAQVGVGAALTATGVGAGVGVGLMSSGVGGVAGDYAQQRQIKAQKAQAKQMEANQVLANKTQELNNETVNTYGAVMREGGEIPTKKKKYYVKSPAGRIEISKEELPNIKRYLETEKKFSKEFGKRYKTRLSELAKESEGNLTPESYAKIIEKDPSKIIPDYPYGDFATNAKISQEEIDNALKYRDRFIPVEYTRGTKEDNILKTSGTAYSTRNSLLSAQLELQEEEDKSEMSIPDPVSKNIGWEPYRGFAGITLGYESVDGKRVPTTFRNSAGREVPINPKIGMDPNSYPELTKEYQYEGTSTKRNGGTINYSGQLHEGPNGGVPVDGLGNVNMNNPAALVEKGEVSYMNPNKETYVFSDTLKFDRNRTFAKEAKNVQSKLKLRMKNGKVTDPIASRYYDKEMDKLTEAQEKLREYTGLEEKIKTFRRGGILPKYDPQIDLNRYDEFVDQVNMDYPSRSRISPNLNAKVTTTSPVLPTRSEIRNDLNKDANNNPVTYEPYTGMSSGQMWASATPSLLASGIGLASELINKRTPRKLSLARMTPQQISLDRSRQTAKEEANVARANISRSLRGSSPTAGGYMANMIAGETGVQRELGKQLGESYTQEELTNAQFRQQADAANLETSMRESEYNTQAENMFDEARRSRINQYVSQGLTGVSNAISSKYQSERDADFLNMLNPDYMIMKDPKTGKKVYRPRPKSNG